MLEVDRVDVSVGWTPIGMFMWQRWWTPSVGCWHRHRFRADATGYEQLGNWLGSHGRIVRVGIEGTGSYGAGLTRHLISTGVEVAEVNRPNRQFPPPMGQDRHYRRPGRGAGCSQRPGQRVAQKRQRTSRSNQDAVCGSSFGDQGPYPRPSTQIHALVVTAPDQVKHHLSGLSPKARVKVCAGFRPGTTNTTIRYAKQALRSLARRYQILTAEIRELDTEINRLCAQANPALLATPGIGPDIAAALLIAAGDNPERMTSEASFAALCGVSPVQASRDVSSATASTRRQPPSQPGSVADRHHPHCKRPAHHRLCEKTPERKAKPAERSSAVSNGT